MKQFFTILFTMTALVAAAQESHYHRAMHSQAENDKYGTVGAAPHFEGGGVYWSRVRSQEDGLIVKDFRLDSIARRTEFIRLCQIAYDAFDEGDYYRTAIAGDSALSKKYYTPELYYYMALSLEKLQCYKDADAAYKKALKVGYTKAIGPYNTFLKRMEELKAQDKIRKKEARKNHEKFVPLSEGKDYPEPIPFKREPSLQIIGSSLKVYCPDGENIIKAGSSCVLHFNLVNNGNAPTGKCAISLAAKNSGDMLNIGKIPPVVVKPKETLVIDIPIEADNTLTDGEAELLLMVEEANGYGLQPRNIKVKTQK
jgi:tetratricopeptide (TPR) repeat protein